MKTLSNITFPQWHNVSNVQNKMVDNFYDNNEFKMSWTHIESQVHELVITKFDTNIWINLSDH
jgi:hypothetical protein